MAAVDQKAYLKLFQGRGDPGGEIRRTDGEGHISFLGGKEALHLLVRIFPVMDADVGILFPEGGDAVRGDQTQDTIGGQKVDLVILTLGDFTDAVAQSVVIGQQDIQMIAEVLTGFRQCDAGGVPG